MTDVARLRFVMSADSGGLKSGCKEAAGSLKDLSGQTDQAMNRMDSGTIDFKALRKSARSLKFVGREMGGVLKSGLGDAMGIASAGIGLGPMGAALAVGAAGVGLYQSHQDALDKDRTKAAESFRGARAHGIDASTYRNLSAIAGDDTKFLDDMAGGMKELANAGPNASDSLKKLGEDINHLGRFTGTSAETEAEKREQLAKSGEKHTENLAGWSGEKRLALMQKELNLSDEEMGKFSHKTIQGNWEMGERTWGGIGSGDNAAYREHMAELEEKRQKVESRVEGTGELKTGFQTNREKLNDRLSHLKDLKEAGVDDTLVGRATSEAMKDYEKSQGGGPVGMAGASTAGSAEAYSVIAGAQMTAASGSDSAATNAILQSQFPELINAVKALNPNWRRADGPT